MKTVEIYGHKYLVAGEETKVTTQVFNDIARDGITQDITQVFKWLEELDPQRQPDWRQRVEVIRGQLQSLADRAKRLVVTTDEIYRRHR